MKKIIKCYFLSCKESVEVDIDEAPQTNGSATTLVPGVLGAGASTFGNADYTRVPFAPRDEHRLSGKPWVCAFHDAMVGATLGLSPHEERQLRELVTQVRLGKMTKSEDGWYAEVPPKAVTPYTIREDDGSVRRHGMVRWFSQEQMIDKLNGENAQPRGYTVHEPEPMSATEAVALVEKINAPKAKPLGYGVTVNDLPPGARGNASRTTPVSSDDGED